MVGEEAGLAVVALVVVDMLFQLNDKRHDDCGRPLQIAVVSFTSWKS
jgi:hypothetical protein